VLASWSKLLNLQYKVLKLRPILLVPLMRREGEREKVETEKLFEALSIQSEMLYKCRFCCKKYDKSIRNDFLCTYSSLSIWWEINGILSSHWVKMVVYWMTVSKLKKYFPAQNQKRKNEKNYKILDSFITLVHILKSFRNTCLEGKCQYHWNINNTCEMRKCPLKLIVKLLVMH
jgi:hypothetical protein